MSERDESLPDAPASPGAEPGPVEDEYGVGRLLALSDGVFAIAMTLLVLDVAVPLVRRQDTNQDAVQALGQAAHSLAVFGFSFAIVAICWLNHHAAMRRLREAPSALQFRNLLFLLLVCVVPFSSAFFQRFEGTRIGDAVYFGNLVLISAVSIVTLPRRHQLRHARQSARPTRYVPGVLLDQFGTPVIFVIGLAVSLWLPEVGPVLVLALMVVHAAVQRLLLTGFEEPV